MLFSKMKRNLLYLIISALFFVSCTDDLFEGGSTIPEGQSLVTATVEFSPLVPALSGKTRSEGDAVKSINSLCVLFYDADGNLAYHRPLTAGGTSGVPDTYVVTDSARVSDTESVTPHADLTMSVPYGRYYIYVVANMGDLSGYADRIKTVSGLKSLPLRWNSDDISANGQMLGHFCDDKTIEDTAPLLTIDKKNTTFHSWIRRAASKVTVAYDGSKLEEGVFIYLKSVQIKDIPLNCPLGDSNEPGENDRLITDGETITYGTGTNYDEFWPARITKGRAYYPYDKDTYGLSADAHTEKAEALYFYENMQGEGESKKQDWKDPGHITYPEGNDPSKPGFKDNKKYGTYIEVKAFYRSINSDRVGSGDIVYRFMLGKDTEKDYNAERNHHYRLTLKFNRYANDVDWHIDYEEEMPGVEIPDPYFISYLYNHSMMLPFKINTGSYKVDKIVAHIDSNAWAPYNPDKDFEYCKEADPDVYPNLPADRWKGFLSLKKTVGLNIDDNGVFENKKLGDREYPYVDNGNLVGSLDSGQYRVVTDPEAKTVTYHIPLFTREKLLVTTTSLTGNNPYEAYRRKAVLNLDVKLKDAENNLRIVKAKTHIMQVRRITNPKGVWRRHDNIKPFRVVLKHRLSETAKDYSTFTSEGPWKAYVVTGDRQTIHLDGDTVKGSTGTPVDFKIRFKGCGEKETRCAIIRVEYNNYSCYHLIFVCQGSAPIELIKGGAKWHLCNMRTGTEEAGQPTEEGSMFKFGNWDTPIDAKSNVNDLGNWNTRNVQPKDFANHANTDFIIAGKSGTMKWSEIRAANHSGEFVNPVVNGKEIQVATYEDYAALLGDSSIAQGYGVLYGDDADSTLSDVDEVYGYCYDNEGKGYGMRGCFVYNKSLTDSHGGRNVFFPMGRSGYGHRKHSEIELWKNREKFTAVLRYSAGQTQVIGNPTGRPLFYDFYKRPGATYWLGKRFGSETRGTIGWDINYYTLDFNILGINNLFDNPFKPGSSTDKENLEDVSHACFVRCIEKKQSSR